MSIGPRYKSIHTMFAAGTELATKAGPGRLGEWPVHCDLRVLDDTILTGFTDLKATTAPRKSKHLLCDYVRLLAPGSISTVSFAECNL